MTIKNFEKLARTKSRKKALKIVETGFKAIKTKEVLEGQVQLKKNELFLKEKSYNLDKFDKIYFIGIGKASLETAEYFDNLLGSKIDRGISISVEKRPLENIETIKGTHPLPSKKNMNAAKKIVDLAESTGKNDLVLTCISGGGSALFALPEKLNLAQLKDLNDQLLHSGADIYEINTIRKHISKVKGGKLAKMIHPAKTASVIFSDVPGDNLSFIASGPLVKDETTIEDAKEVRKKYDLKKLKFYPTPKKDKYFQKIDNLLLISGKTTLEAMEKKAKELGLTPKIYTNKLEGEARKEGKKVVQTLSESRHTCLLACGETTVTVSGEGKGGRNQEVVLGGLSELQKNQVLISAASDGWDNSNAAGAVADGQSAEKAKELNLDPQKYLTENDSYHFFEKMDDLIKTGKTGANVADFLVCVELSKNEVDNS